MINIILFLLVLITNCYADEITFQQINGDDEHVTRIVSTVIDVQSVQRDIDFCNDQVARKQAECDALSNSINVAETNGVIQANKISGTRNISTP